MTWLLAHAGGIESVAIVVAFLALAAAQLLADKRMQHLEHEVAAIHSGDAAATGPTTPAVKQRYDAMIDAADDRAEADA